MSDIFRDVFLGFIRVHILHHAAEHPIYGNEMILELGRHGYDISPGTIYPIFHGLEKAGYLTSRKEVAQGKVRKNYVITPAGHKALIRLKGQIHELTSEVLGEDALIGKKAAKVSSSKHLRRTANSLRK